MKYLIFIFISFNAFALDQSSFYFVKKSNCQLRLAPLSKKASFLKSKIVKLLSNKGYKVTSFFDNKRVMPGDEYIRVQVIRTKDFWKKCGIEIIIRQANQNTPNIKDKLILKHQTMRSLPRVTPSGNERCTRALKDVLVHLPYCKN